MIASIWAKQIILGNKTFVQVPRKLKDAVKAILIEEGREDLVTE